MRKPAVTIRVPATTSNLGPGFDTLGIALKFHNTVSLRETDEPGVAWVGASRAKGSPAATALARQAAESYFERARVKPHGLQVEVAGEVPVARGLGSSVTLRLGVVYGLNEINGRPLSDAQMLGLVVDLEGHPDNCAPALFGGFVVSGRVAGTVQYRRFSVPNRLKFVCCIPATEVPTDRARALLPRQVPFGDAVDNLNRVALLTATFAAGEFSLLRGLFDDRLHQPYRRKLTPYLDEVVGAGVDAGALGGWLSGSGSTVICLTENQPREIAAAMERILVARRVSFHTHILVTDNDGTRVRRA